MPILQVLIIGSLGAFLATGYCNILPADARKSVNKVRDISHICVLEFIFSFIKASTIHNIMSFWGNADRVHRVYSLTHVCESRPNCHTPGHDLMVG